MGEEFVDQHHYQILVGSLIFFTHTHPDFFFVVNYVNRYMFAPQKTHMDALKWILRYIQGTSEYGMTLKPSQNGLQLADFVDVDWGRDLGKWKSTTEIIFKLNDNMIN
jgi:histone deacetylase 1/2